MQSSQKCGAFFARLKAVCAKIVEQMCEECFLMVFLFENVLHLGKTPYYIYGSQLYIVLNYILFSIIYMALTEDTDTQILQCRQKHREGEAFKEGTDCEQQRRRRIGS